mmetsp:Transcript_22969/g.52556  ORF Transcript_22969/g.52556 Transcript_22969/m.52556 type:complete len:293 (-) Transcript_22969:409-1287(-)
MQAPLYQNLVLCLDLDGDQGVILEDALEDKETPIVKGKPLSTVQHNLDCWNLADLLDAPPELHLHEGELALVPEPLGDAVLRVVDISQWQLHESRCHQAWHIPADLASLDKPLCDCGSPAKKEIWAAEEVDGVVHPRLPLGLPPHEGTLHELCLDLRLVDAAEDLPESLRGVLQQCVRPSERIEHGVVRSVEGVSEREYLHHWQVVNELLSNDQVLCHALRVGAIRQATCDFHIGEHDVSQLHSAGAAEFVEVGREMHKVQERLLAARLRIDALGNVLHMSQVPGPARQAEG